LEADKHFRVLLIEGKSGNHAHFAKELLQRGFNIIQVESGNSGLKLVKEQCLTHVIVINAASLRTSGTRMCNTFRTTLPIIPIILIVAEKVNLVKFSDASVILNLPFTVQKLINRLQVYQPAEDKLLYSIGPLVLNLQTNFLTCNGHETRLTPRLSSLLKYMMDRPGKIVDRETLFKDVWETDYLGDTRTLDVHISWLRQAVEENPRKPKLIQTIRSQGYKFDV